ncbi:glycosyltransferase [Vibrio breoganii]|uniref:glycosyltransferase n=1 Tax=Vibrio breoganii TaxID=553239 RepID=UPI000C819883|nr:glycosyltransferase [Vibrio breoganii]PMG95096.1 hypothetical protein BCU81_00050 [Vibrio breoganii]
MKVTICCAVFNRFEYIKESVDSLLSQEFNDYNIVIVNDGSTDIRIKKYLDSIVSDRLTIIHQENEGFVSSIIKAINVSDSEYIAIHGHGDISLPNRLETQSRLLDKMKDVAAVSCTYSNQTINSDWEVDKNRSLEHAQKGILTKSDFLMKNHFSHGEVMFRRDIYDRVGGYRKQFTYAQDYDLWLRMLNEFDFYKVDEKLYIQRSFENDGIKFNPMKLIKQQLYADFARQLDSDNFDSQLILKEFGRESIFFAKPSKKIINIICKEAIKARLRDEKELSDLLISISFNNKVTILNTVSKFVLILSYKFRLFLYLLNKTRN